MRRETVLNIFSRIPTIKTERLTLRALRASDAEDMFEYAGKYPVTEYLLWSPHPSVGYTRDYLRSIEGRYAIGDFFDWGVTLTDSGKMIGTCGFTRLELPHNAGEIGYVINPEYHGNGYGIEAARAVVAFGFEKLALNRVEARYMVGNTASEKVTEKLGMTFEGVKRSSMLVKGIYRDIATASLLREEYLASRPS